MVVGVGRVESSNDVKCSELCIENVIGLFEAITGTDAFGCFASEGAIWEVFGEDGQELVAAGMRAREGALEEGGSYVV